MPAPKTTNPSPNTLRQRRFALRQRQRIADLEAEVDALKRQLHEAQQRYKKIPRIVRWLFNL